ncbi:MAG: hypothetical protein PWP76_659 [Candidatus Diapherotrites archaeon]|nr:hypothetical protein [Candidatus Diapherotrites archaeon]MDN5367014.1 hypothetical protein [Candidatus Diapherotrites archaeon]
MRGQISLETIIVIAAFAGIFLILLDNYTNLFDVVMGGMDKKKAEYAAALISDALHGCPASKLTVRLPYEVEIDCSSGTVKVGEASVELDESCSGGGKSRAFRVEGCNITPI